MTEPVHPAFSGHLPWFITPPGETDVLMILMAIIAVLFVQLVGVLYFHLLALPASYAHTKLQYEIVCVLSLVALFTRMTIFWIAAVLLAFVELPNFSGPLGRIAEGTEKIAGRAHQNRKRASVSPAQTDPKHREDLAARASNSNQQLPAVTQATRSESSSPTRGT